jgi:hypothetical protein
MGNMLYFKWTGFGGSVLHRKLVRYIPKKTAVLKRHTNAGAVVRIFSMLWHVKRCHRLPSE